MAIEYRFLPESSGTSPDGSTEEVFTDNRPEWMHHVNSAGVLTIEGYKALNQHMRLDEIERRELVE